MVRALIHPRLLEKLSNFFPNTCTIQEMAEDADRAPSGKPNKDSWSDLAEHVNIPCRIAPSSGGEKKQDVQTFVQKMPRILLQGYFPTITEKMQAVTDDGAAWDILHVEHDGQHIETRLSVEKVS